jgi:hypothetical protein
VVQLTCPPTRGRLTFNGASPSEESTVVMAIDNQYDAIAKAYPEKEPSLPTDLALLAAKFALPGIITDAFSTVCERLDRKAQEERAKATIKLLMADLKDLKERKASKEELDDLKESIQLTIRHDVAEFNDRKRERYIKIIGNALRSEKRIDDLASYIQDVERLGERDVAALKVLNTVMNPARRDSTKDIHPNEFIHRRQELSVEMSKVVGGAFEGPSISREEGYDACNRLQGFGLAHELELSARQVPIGEYCFRPSRRGLMFLKLLGEKVENADKYHL